jgi:hypothetical protein
MKFMVMVHIDEAKLPALSAEERARVPREHGVYAAELRAAGVYVAGNRLQPGAKARRFRQQDGKRLLIDGPHIETREVIGGYYLIECKDEAEALAWAARCPMWDGDVLEVRPIWDMTNVGVLAG